jgi:hypothetical protein
MLRKFFRDIFDRVRSNKLRLLTFFGSVALATSLTCYTQYATHNVGGVVLTGAIALLLVIIV